MAKIGRTSVVDTVTKRVELTLAKMGGAHHGKTGWNYRYRHRGKNGLSSLWQKRVELVL